MSAVLAIDRWPWDLFVGLERFAVHEPHGRRQRRLSLFLLACTGLGVELCISRMGEGWSRDVTRGVEQVDIACWVATWGQGRVHGWWSRDDGEQLAREENTEQGWAA